VAVDLGDHVPAVGLEALGGVVEEPARGVTVAAHLAVDGDVVVVVDGDQLAEPQRAGQEQASWEMPSIRQPSPRKT
jgi:hypothetical protein